MARTEGVRNASEPLSRCHCQDVLLTTKKEMTPLYALGRLDVGPSLSSFDIKPFFPLAFSSPLQSSSFLVAVLSTIFFLIFAYRFFFSCSRIFPLCCVPVSVVRLGFFHSVFPALALPRRQRGLRRMASQWPVTSAPCTVAVLWTPSQLDPEQGLQGAMVQQTVRIYAHVGSDVICREGASTGIRRYAYGLRSAESKCKRLIPQG